MDKNSEIPRGQGRGQGRRRQVRRFLEPCLLLLIHQGESHGYQLQDELARFGFLPGRLDVSMVYRSLREMETQGWLESRWDDAGEGPRRRVYMLTEVGLKQLHWSVEELKRTRRDIDGLLKAYASAGLDPAT